jgi:O-antigen chain-terminating methyltransferase
MDEILLQSIQSILEELRVLSRRSWWHRLFRPVDERHIVQLGEEILASIAAQSGRLTAHQKLLEGYNGTLVAHEGRLNHQTVVLAQLGRLSAQVGALASHATAVLGAIEQHTEQLENLRRQICTQSSAIDTLSNQIETADELHRGLLKQITDARNAQIALESVVKTTAAEVDKTDRTVRLVKDELGTQIESTRALMRERGPDRPAEFADFYLAFENEFRGSMEEITRRHQVYIPPVHVALKNNPQGVWLDLGCGRGEWMDVLLASGVRAEGVDNNAAMLSLCRARNLTVHEGDALEILERLPVNSLAGVSAFHLMEHLPYRTMLALFHAVYRALAPGGLFIMETPNPQNVSVGACNFYMDITHQKPIPPMTAQFIASHAGFPQVEVLRLHPHARHAERDSLPTVTDREYCEMFYGPQDYAILATK